MGALWSNEPLKEYVEPAILEPYFGVDPDILKIDTKVCLRNGNLMPIFGLGTCHAKGDEIKEALQAAIGNGYQMLDTAENYGNEKEIGEVLALYDAEFFVTTKVSEAGHLSKKALRDGVINSLKQFQRDCIDLYLIHFPTGGLVIDTYTALLELRDEGYIKNVGVSNFGILQLEGLKNSGLELPQVNQIELHCFWQQNQLVQYCRDNGIQVMGWSPMCANGKNENDVLQKICENHDHKTPAQILIRWSLQMGVVTIPKSKKPERIAENCDVCDFELDEEDLELLATLRKETCLQRKYYSVPWQDVPWDLIADCSFDAFGYLDIYKNS